MYVWKSPDEHITETQSIITEIENQNKIHKLKGDANKFRLIDRQSEGQQIDKTMQNTNIYTVIFTYINDIKLSRIGW